MADPQDPRVAVYLDFDNIVMSWYDQVHGRNSYSRDRQKIAEDPSEQTIAERLARATVDLARTTIDLGQTMVDLARDNGARTTYDHAGLSWPTTEGARSYGVRGTTFRHARTVERESTDGRASDSGA